MKDFASTLREARTQGGLTLEALARKAGTEKGYLSGIERRKVNPPSPRITKKLARTLGLDVQVLLVHAFVERAPLEIREIMRTGALRELAERHYPDVPLVRQAL